MSYFLQLILTLLVASSTLWSGSAAALDVPATAFAQGAFDNGEARVETRLIVDRDEVALGEEIRVGVLFELEPEWHVYGEEPGDAGLPTSILWYSEGADVQITSWPATEEFVDPSGRIRTNGYSERVVFESDATVVQTDGTLELSVDVDYLACKIQCLPGTAKLRRSVPIGTSKPASEQVLALFDNFGRDRIAPVADTSSETASTTTPALAATGEAAVAPAAPTPAGVPLWQALLLALLGGVLLNLMPCVFPVLALKVFGFVSTAAHRPTALKHSAAYAGGIVGSMMILATVVVAVKLGGDAVGWGFQFQSPGYLVALTLFIVVFAVNLFGVFDVQSLPLPSNSGEASIGRSFVDGALAVVLATPCSAPFLGTAVGFALASGPAVIYATFIAVGLGLAAPFMIACIVPGVGKRLPRPGAWMEQLERFLGFVLLGTAVWLLWVFGQSAGVDGITALLVCALLASLGGWVYGRLQYRGSASKWLGLSAAVALLALPTATLQPWRIAAPTSAAQVAEAGGFIPWDPAQIRAEQAAGRAVFVDFTADWCITCKVNEHAALSSDEIWAFFAKNNVVVMKADWTNKSEPIRLALAEHGRAGVPMYLVYPAGGGAPELLPEVLTESIVMAAVTKSLQTGQSE